MIVLNLLRVAMLYFLVLGDIALAQEIILDCKDVTAHSFDDWIVEERTRNRKITFNPASKVVMVDTYWGPRSGKVVSIHKYGDANTNLPADKSPFAGITIPIGSSLRNRIVLSEDIFIDLVNLTAEAKYIYDSKGATEKAKEGISGWYQCRQLKD